MVETSPGNFQAWLKHDDVYPTDLSTFVAQTLAGRYQADPSAADWRRFRQASRFHELQAEVSQGQRSLSLRAAAQLHVALNTGWRSLLRD